MTTKLKDNAKIILPKDILERSPDSYLKELKSLVINKPAKILLDCSELRQVISGHINILWQSRLICEQAEVPVYLANAAVNLIRVLKLLDLYELFNFDGTIETLDEDTIKTKRLFNKNLELNLEFRCQKSDIINSQNQFREYLHQLSIPPTHIYDLETIFYEVVVNISVHSHLSEDQTVKFRAAPKDNRIVLYFKDQGRPFDPTQNNREFNPSDSAAIGQKRGYGLIMINRMADKIVYGRKDNGTNVLILEKYWR